jgi:hypothetical protein
MTAALAEAIPQAQPIMPPDMMTAPTDDATATQSPVEATAADTIQPDTGQPDTNQQAQIAEAIKAATDPEPLAEEIKIGFEKLRAMNHNDLRAVIARRVELLETVLRDREDRRAAIETARLASRMLELRRDRALRIQKRVNFGSAMAAVASTLLIVAIMI